MHQNALIILYSHCVKLFFIEDRGHADCYKYLVSFGILLLPFMFKSDFSALD